MPLHHTDPPRWVNGPAICRKANLPAFETPADAKRYFKNNCPGHAIMAIKPCSHCDGVHVTESKAPSPSGDSSGNGRPKLELTSKARRHNQELSDRDEVEFNRAQMAPETSQAVLKKQPERKKSLASKPKPGLI